MIKSMSYEEATLDRGHRHEAFLSAPSRWFPSGVLELPLIEGMLQCRDRTDRRARSTT